MKRKEKQFDIGLRVGYKIQEIMNDKRIRWVLIFKKENNLSERTYYRLFKKGNNPTIKTLFAIAKALDVHPKELLDFDMTFEAVEPKRGNVHEYTPIQRRKL